MVANISLKSVPDTESVVTVEECREMIAECAYFKAEKRGFVPGHELDDWLAAERETNTLNFYRFRT